jgi:hypothetical protein
MKEITAQQGRITGYVVIDNVNQLGKNSFVMLILSPSPLSMAGDSEIFNDDLTV